MLLALAAVAFAMTKCSVLPHLTAEGELWVISICFSVPYTDLGRLTITVQIRMT
jgi:hypothetical protein